MAPIVVRYPLDPTGISPDNLVLKEEHTLGNRPIKALATHYGGFFTESVVVREKSTQRVLTKNVDYYCGELYPIPTARYGKEICAVIVITDSSVQSVVEVDYQALGGAWSTSQQAIIQMINNLNLDDRPVRWGDIIGKPSEFNPAHHLHDAGDIYGFEYVVAALERIYQAILIGDSASHDEIYAYIDNALDGINDIFNGLNETLTDHIEDKNNPHEVTPAKINAYDKQEINALLSNLANTKLDIAGGTMNGPIVGSSTSLALVQGNYNDNGSFTFRNETASAGSNNIAGATFLANTTMIKMGLSTSGIFGIGGGSYGAYRWYTDAAGNSFSSGDTYIYSDPRLKENQEKIDSALDKINLIKGYTFTWKDIGPKLAMAGKKDIGFMADEVEKVFPDMVTDAIEIDGVKYKTVAYTKMVPVLLEAVKELSAEVTKLKYGIR